MCSLWVCGPVETAEGGMVASSAEPASWPAGLTPTLYGLLSIFGPVSGPTGPFFWEAMSILGYLPL